MSYSSNYYYTITETVEDNATTAFVWLSKDGFYWNGIKIPNNLYNITQVFENGDEFVIQSGALLNVVCVAFNKKDVYNKMEVKLTDYSLYVKLNDAILGFDTPPVLENDRTLVPMRFLFERMGEEVLWDENTQTATVKGKNKQLSFSIDNTQAKVNGKTKIMDAPARLINDKTMVPLRFISEELGYTVEWDEQYNIAKIITE